MYDCSILKCSHNKNGICLGECEQECMDYPIAEYLATDQLRKANRCKRYGKQNCKGCPDAQYCPNYISYKDCLIDNYTVVHYAAVQSNDALD